MYPLLFKLGFLKIHSYGLLIVIGFLVGLYLIQRRAKIEGIDPEKVTDLSFWGLGLGLVGGRVVYIITRLDYFMANPIEIFQFWKGGLVFYGGFIGGVFGFWYFSRKFKLPILKTLDLAAPSLAIAHFFGRIGCLLAGCCYGRPAEGIPWAIIFRPPGNLSPEEANEILLAPLNIPLHPTQLYDALNAVLLFAVLFFVQRKKKFDGQLVIIYMVWYSIGRGIVEMYRGDSIRGFVIENMLSTSQFLSIFVFIGGIFLWSKWSKPSPPSSVTETKRGRKK